MTKQILVVYHANCKDGLTAAAAFYSMLKDDAEYLPGIYQDANFDIEVFRSRHVYIVDFSYPLSLMEQICEVAEKVTLLDHHESAIQACKHITAKNFDMSRCTTERSGAAIAWNFVSGYTPLLVKFVEDYDTWKFQHEETKLINAALDLEERSVRHYFELVTERSIASLVHTGQTLIALQDVYLDSIMHGCLRTMPIGGMNLTVANANGMFASKLGNRIAEANDPKIGATYYDTRHGRVFSLRSIGDIDVSEIAKLYGGGGHKNAAGFKVPRDSILAQL